MSEPKPPTTPPDVHIDIEATLPDVHFDVDATLPDVHFDVDAKRPYIIPRHQNSGISLERQENSDASSQIHYFKGTNNISVDFYFEINLKDKPSAVWLGFVTENWSNADYEKNVTWSYQPLIGSLKFDEMLYAHDPITTDGSITIGFGVRRFKVNDEDNTEEEDYWSVVYMKNDGEGREIVRKGRFPDHLCPAIRLVQSSPDLEIKTTDFTHQNRQPFHLPHHAPIGLYECSPDRHYAASFSGDDGILSLWRLDSERAPEFVQRIPVPDFKIDPDEVHSSSLEFPHDQFSLAISNTPDNNQLPQLVLARYHANLTPDECKVIFLRITTKDSHTRLDNVRTVVGRKRSIVGHVHILDDGHTLLILGSKRLFIVNMESRSLIRSFDRKHLDVKAFKGRSEPVADRKPPLKLLGQRHFLWHNSPDYATMWNVRTSSLVQTFRYTFKVDDKYDYNSSHDLIAFYGTGGLKIFTTQTGISICEADRLDMGNMKVVGAKFVTINNNLFLVTMDGSNTKYTIGVWCPLTATKVKEAILADHSLSEEFKYSDVAISSTGHKFKNSDEAFDITGSSSISFVTPLKATIARLFVSNLNDLLPSSVVETPSEKTLPKTLEFKKPPAIIPCQGQPNRSLKVAHKDQSQECQVEILGVNKRRAVTFRPEPWNGESLACDWISNDRFVVVGQHAVQIINAVQSTDKLPAIEFVWCLPSLDASFTKIELKSGETVLQITLGYLLDGKPFTETVDIVKPSIPLVKPSISPKHASRYIQYAGETYQSRTFHVYLKSLKEVMESTDNKKFLMNEVEPKTRTSTFGHIIRGPPTEVVSRVQTVLKANAYRPLFYDTELWDASALTEALSVGNFEVVEDIVRYCLKKDISKNSDTLLELGYISIVVGALPTVARKKPALATLIAQYISHIQLDRFISGFPEIDIDTRKFTDGVFARVEQLPNDILFPSPSALRIPNKKRPLRGWWAKQQKSFDLWWNEQRTPHPIRMCVSPLYGLNRYPPVRSQLSVFAQLAFRQSPMFDEPAFEAVVHYKWNAFARRYHNCLLFLYTSYALIYLIAVSISPYTLMIPGVKITLIVLTVLFLVAFDIRPLLKRWKSLTYWSSIYHWIDRAAFVLVLLSTILTSPDYGPSVDLQAWTVLALWLFVVFNFRVFRGLGLFFTLLIQILKSLGWLAILMTAIIFAFSHSMWVLLRNAPLPDTINNPFSDMDGSLKSLWQFLGGDFNAIDNWNAGRSTDIMRVLFTFITTIVLLNVLIALLNNVYTDTQEIARKTWIRNRAEFIATVEVFMLSADQRQDKNWFPAIVFYEVTPDRFREYEEKVKSIHPWIKSESPARI